MMRLGVILAVLLAVAVPAAATPVAKRPAPTAAAAARASNALGADLLRRGGGGNTALSPWSIWTALSMAYAGADGQTRAQMTRVLHAHGLGDGTGRAGAKLLRALRGSAKQSGASLDAANALWGATDASFRARFLSAL